MAPRNEYVCNINDQSSNATMYNVMCNITRRERSMVRAAPSFLQNVTIRNKTQSDYINREEKRKGEGSFSTLAVAVSSNPDLVSDYVSEIYSHLSDLETRSTIKPRFLQGHQVTPWMRAVLVDWLVQVHQRFSLLQESLLLTVGILDRALQADKHITRDNLQLLGITALFIASKFEEVCPPDLDDLVYLTAGCYTKADVHRMEIRVFTTLNWNISFPIPIHFLRRYSKVGRATAQQHTLAKFLIDLSLQEYKLRQHQPSILAAAALYLAQIVLPGNNHWNDILKHYSGYNENQLKPLVGQLAGVLDASQSNKLMAVREKYRFYNYFSYSRINENIVKDIIVKYATL